MIWAGIFATAVVLGHLSATGRLPSLSLPKLGSHVTVERSFALCGILRDDNCVIDGDTFKFNGQSIRIADIDAPETHPARCKHEAELGDAATERLKELLNEAPFVLRMQGRDEDQYERKLRIVTRSGRSLGAVLVNEGLAREWTGHRRPWC
jgi:micrococcal nuclease